MAAPTASTRATDGSQAPRVAGERSRLNTATSTTYPAAPMERKVRTSRETGRRRTTSRNCIAALRWCCPRRLRDRRRGTGQLVPAPHQHATQCLAHDARAHLRLAETAVAEGDRHLDDRERGATRAPRVLDLEAVAVRL